MKPEVVRLGIIGLGNMGRHHVDTVLNDRVPGCELTAVCDSNPVKQSVGKGLPFYTRSSDLIRSGKVDAVLIATPHYSHTPIGIEALEAGLHVLVEKPLSVHKADCLRLLATPRQKSQVFAVMLNQRTDPYYQTIRRMVQDGELGRIHRIHWTITDWFRSQAYYDSSSWRATWEGEGGGVLLNQSVHNLDLFQWIFGMPHKVHAVCSLARYHYIEVEDEVSAIFQYYDGTTATFITSTGEAPGVNRLEVIGDMGRLVKEGNRLSFHRNQVSSSDYIRSTPEGYLTPPVEIRNIDIPDHGEQHTGIIKNFVGAILRDDKLLSPANDGIHAVELINAMILSSMHQSIVELPIQAAVYEKTLQNLIFNSHFHKTVSPYQGGFGNYLQKSST
ncbi:MAG: hypothetical protein B9S32_14745 [Verrucomicrobia bacterium Tous-C9LFEB]|nr:MAG: hypothetical protein B9S32_14745 [Verrucomicrobia bacterium Tous-C9LFEB]